MRLLSRWLSLRWRLQTRYWKRRALLAERQLTAEKYRNMEREDVFASAAVLGSRGMYGIPPRSGPAHVPQRALPAQTKVTTDPWEQLPYADRMEYETIWKVDAERHGVPDLQAKQDFLRELANRRALNDEPYN